MQTDIVERLLITSGENSGYENGLMREAADYIKRLRTIVSGVDLALEDERTAHQVCVQMRNGAYGEIDRLRAALKRALVWMESDIAREWWAHNELYRNDLKIVRDALNIQQHPTVNAMTDIVEEVRALARGGITPLSLAARKAADEIDQLRAKLAYAVAGYKEAADEIERLQMVRGDLLSEIERLRAALERMLNDSMFKDHPEASQMAIAALDWKHL